MDNILIVVCAVAVFALAAVGFCFLNKNKKTKEYKQMFAGLPEEFTYTAHTGCMGTEENSLEAIDAAINSGADVIEIDLHFDKNGEPVLSHDAPKGGEVTLDEAFAKISGSKHPKINVDVKSTEALEKIKPLAEKYGLQDRIFFTGVHDKFLDAVRSDGCGVSYYLNVDVKSEGKHTPEYLESLVRKVKDSGAIGINFNKNSASKELVDAFRANGLLVSIWTVDSEAEMYRILSYAPDNITTRNPDKLVEAINSLK